MTSAVAVIGLSKKYRLGSAGYGRLTESLWDLMSRPWARRGSSKREEIWALRDVSLTVQSGEVFGIIGRNGAGKSTLLKILSRITAPTEGEVRIHGRVSALLEVGTGFHPELTGRENVFLNGAILGMRRREIERKLEAIVAFSEIDRFIDTPVKRYSSGMHVRLAFSVAAHLEPDVLVIDEVLAVGDLGFQKKCLGRVDDVAKSGRTVLFVSHNMAAVEAHCGNAVLLEGGRIAKRGSASEVIREYVDSFLSLQGTDLSDRPDRQGSGRLRFEELLTIGPDGTTSAMSCGRPGAIAIRYGAEEDLSNVAISIGLFDQSGQGALFVGTDLGGADFTSPPRRGYFRCEFERVQLLPGRYRVNLYSTVNGVMADWIIDAGTIDVAGGDFYGSGRLPPPGYGSVTVPHSWSTALTVDHEPPCH